MLTSTPHGRAPTRSAGRTGREATIVLPTRQLRVNSDTPEASSASPQLARVGVEATAASVVVDDPIMESLRLLDGLCV